MKWKTIIATIVLVPCLVTVAFSADEQPKRVMNFLAVMDLKCGKEIAKEQCSALTDVLIDEMVKMKKYTVIDRANRDKILSEAGFQQTGCVDESCTIEMGRQLGVGKIIVGSVTMMGETYLVNLQLLNVETAAVETSARETCEKCKIDNLIATTAGTVRKLMGEEAPPPATTGATGEGQGKKIGGQNCVERIGICVSDVSSEGAGAGQPQTVVAIGLLAAPAGVKVTDVNPNGIAAKAGIMKDDSIFRINRRIISSAADFKKVVELLSPGKVVILTGARGGKRMTFQLQMPGGTAGGVK